MGGTNQLHGEGHWFVRNSALADRDFFAKKAGTRPPDFKDNRYGGSAGGPVISLGFSQALVRLADPAFATIPRVRAGGYSAISPWETGDGTTESLTHTFVAGVTTLRGRHNMKFGADFRIYRAVGDRFPQSVSPDLNFAST